MQPEIKVHVYDRTLFRLPHRMDDLKPPKNAAEIEETVVQVEVHLIAGKGETGEPSKELRTLLVRKANILAADAMAAIHAARREAELVP
ncbi:hypothetical protein [Enterovirga aerilata]|uniref:Uncharacterized protein n=1 Tax=Enterovirga aerilata TaxID=2730920 RepID=A0A849IEX4_9HYPH|nr:hypothetical protein [Enterovirga sp. DB1703]NNM74775.1 hypothetical protein [Enterovirga sp. DB1703]